MRQENYLYHVKRKAICGILYQIQVSLNTKKLQWVHAGFSTSSPCLPGRAGRKKEERKEEVKREDLAALLFSSSLLAGLF